MPMPPRNRRSAAAGAGRGLRREDTKQRLLDAAQALISQRGYDDVTVTDIARAAGVVPSLINTYFSGKSGLLYAVIERHNAPQLAQTEAAAAGPGTPRERLLRIILAWATGDLLHGRLLGPLQAMTWFWPPETEARNARDRAVFLAVVARVLADGAASGAFRPVPAQEACEAILAIYTWALRPGVFAGATAPDCAARAMAQIDLLLLPA